MSEPSKVIEFRHSFADGYRLVPANGALGGPTTRGDFKIEFFVEAPAVSAGQRHHLFDGNRIGGEIEGSGELVIERRFMAGVVLSVLEAQRLGVWLLERTAEVAASPTGNNDTRTVSNDRDN